MKPLRRSGQVCIHLALSAVLLLSVVHAHAAKFFRYVDEQGKLVLSHTIPNDRVRYGYEIVDENAQLIQKIAPQLSEEEYQRKLAREAAEKECKQVVERIHSMYRSQADIDYAESQALESLDTQIANNKANLNHIRAQRQDLETQAAQLDLSGKAISNALLDNIQRARAQEKNLQEQIEQRYQEKLDVRLSHKFDRQVLELDDCTEGLPSNG